jgi:hypothetical protein
MALAGSPVGAALFGASLAGLVWRAESEWRFAAREIGRALDVLKSRGPFFIRSGETVDPTTDANTKTATVDAAE